MHRVTFRRILHALRHDTVGGVLLFVATLTALILANSEARIFYFGLSETQIGPEALHLHLSVAQWTADGLLAIFFFVIGLELKHEIVAGSLRDFRKAALPIGAAVGGVVVPALIFLLVNARSGESQGWAIPTATDIAFALAILAIFGRRLPTALRAFLLTLAVVDDLLAIVIIAGFYSSNIQLVPLFAALIPAALFTIFVQRGVRRLWILAPLGLLTWVLVHASGVHPTIAGVVLGLAVPASITRHASYERADGTRISLAERFADVWKPISAGIAVPLFAFFAGGVSLVGGLTSPLSGGIATGIVLGLVLGKVAGILGASYLITRIRGYALHPDMRWAHLLAIGFTAGIGFTVSLLIAELAYTPGTPEQAAAKLGVLIGSSCSAIAGAALLAIQNRRTHPQPQPAPPHH